jgi:hypothetical protein
VSYHHLEADTDNIRDNDTAMDVEPKPKEMAKVAKRPVHPKPAKSSQTKDQRNLATDKGSKSDHIRKFFFFCYGCT